MKPAYWPAENSFKNKILADLYPSAVWIVLPAVASVEIAGTNGYDAVILDLEHTSYGLAMVEAMTRAADRAGMTTLVRPPGIDSKLITRVLDSGVQGIVFPMVSSPKEAKAAWKSIRFAPKGTWGWGGGHVRRVNWAGSTALQSRERSASSMYSSEFVAAVEATIVSIFMIETIEGAQNIDEILDVGKPDAVSFGWADFAVDAQFQSGTVEDAFGRVLEACRNRSIGMSFMPGQDLTNVYPRSFMITGVDSIMLAEAMAQRLEQVRLTR